MPSYTDEQKSMAVDMVDECGGLVTRAMRKLGYPTRQTLYHWLNRRDASHERKAGRPWSRYRQGPFANLPISRWGHRPTSCPPSLRAAIRPGNACGPTRFDYVFQPGGHQHQRGFPVGERADDAGSAADLPVQPLDGARDVLGDASHELPQAHRHVLELWHRRLLPHAF